MYKSNERVTNKGSGGLEWMQVVNWDIIIIYYCKFSEVIYVLHMQLNVNS